LINTTDERGILNNYPVEPKMTYQEYPTVYEQKRYLIQGAIALQTSFQNFANSKIRKAENTKI
jgi:hypothetical protein